MIDAEIMPRRGQARPNLLAGPLHHRAPAAAACGLRGREDAAPAEEFDPRDGADLGRGGDTCPYDPASACPSGELANAGSATVVGVLR